jgi:hypothetical protein
MRVSVHLEIMLFLTPYKYMVCAERTTVSKIALDTPDRTPRCVGHVESHFGPFRDSVSIAV